MHDRVPAAAAVASDGSGDRLARACNESRAAERLAGGNMRQFPPDRFLEGDVANLVRQRSPASRHRDEGSDGLHQIGEICATRLDHGFAEAAAK